MKIIPIICFLALNVSCASEINFLKKVDEDTYNANLTTFSGSTSFNSDKNEENPEIEVQNEDGRLVVTSGDMLLFDRHRMKAVLLGGNGNAIIFGLYDTLAQGSSFYGFLICRNTPGGVVSHVQYSNPFLEIQKKDRISYYILYHVDGAELPKQLVICNVFRKDHQLPEKFLAEVEFSSLAGE